MAVVGEGANMKEGEKEEEEEEKDIIYLFIYFLLLQPPLFKATIKTTGLRCSVYTLTIQSSIKAAIFDPYINKNMLNLVSP